MSLTWYQQHTVGEDSVAAHVAWTCLADKMCHSMINRVDGPCNNQFNPRSFRHKPSPKIRKRANEITNYEMCRA